MEYWTIALWGSSVYYSVDTKSEVSLSTLGTSNPMTDANWLKVKIRGMDPVKVKLDELRQHVGAKVSNPVGSVQQFNIQVVPYLFPDDMAELEKLYTLLDKYYIYLYAGDYDFSTGYSWTIHTANKALGIGVVQTVDPDWENGVKNVSLKCQLINPVPR